MYRMVSSYQLPVPISAVGRRRLQEELRRLIEEARPEAALAIRDTARAHGLGDISAAKSQLDALDARIANIEDRLRNSVLIEGDPSAPTDRVSFGATITCIDERGEEHILTLVGPEEAEPSKGHISWNSPIARALSGSAVGDEVEAKTPRGSTFLEITNISRSGSDNPGSAEPVPDPGM